MPYTWNNLESWLPGGRYRKKTDPASRQLISDLDRAIDEVDFKTEIFLGLIRRRRQYFREARELVQRYRSNLIPYPKERLAFYDNVAEKIDEITDRMATPIGLNMINLGYRREELTR